MPSCENYNSRELAIKKEYTQEVKYQNGLAVYFNGRSLGWINYLKEGRNSSQ